jgi:hypothetical protein
MLLSKIKDSTFVKRYMNFFVEVRFKDLKIYSVRFSSCKLYQNLHLVFLLHYMVS